MSRKPNTLNDLLSNIDIKDDNECWLFTGHQAKQRAGHVLMSLNGKKTGVHVHSYMHFVGPIPEGMCVCHTCDVPHCCNPKHLWVGTNVDNIRDRTLKGRTQRYNAYKTHCKHGHEFNEENTYYSKARNRRECRACKRAAWHRNKR